MFATPLHRAPGAILRLAACLARLTARIDRGPMPSGHRLGAWQTQRWEKCESNSQDQ
jgi:hypothetical protein